MSIGKVFALVVIAGVAIYMIVIPGIDVILDLNRQPTGSFKIEEPSALELLRFRSMTLVVFAIFAYAGACVGSFLNVVAASAPRGESIALRSSACPSCGTPIRRIDNLPIYSFVRLRGRCRDCGVKIPVRYFSVEVVGFAIFGSLFLYELVTGAANVPGFKYYPFTGILWIILYTKWPVIGIYALHCALFSCLLTLALMEQDRLVAPRGMKVGLMVFFVGVVLAIPTSLTVSLLDQTPLRFPATFPSWLDRAATCLAGGVLGWGLARVTPLIHLRERQAHTSFTFCMVLLGVTLGWQALLTIFIFWLISFRMMKRWGGVRIRRRWLTASTWLFAIAMLHHPLWKLVANALSF